MHRLDRDSHLPPISAKSLISPIKIWDLYLWWLVNYALFSNFYHFSAVFFLIFHRKDLAEIYQNIPYYNSKQYFFIKKNQFSCIKWDFLVFFYAVFFILLPKFTDFINSDNCIGKITLKTIRIYPVFIQIFFNLLK